VAVFTALFSVSAFVIGPAISGGTVEAPTTTPGPVVTTPGDHDEHH
jgi:hypothetical protein